MIASLYHKEPGSGGGRGRDQLTEKRKRRESIFIYRTLSGSCIVTVAERVSAINNILESKFKEKSTSHSESNSSSITQSHSHFLAIVAAGGGGGE